MALLPLVDDETVVPDLLLSALPCCNVVTLPLGDFDSVPVVVRLVRGSLHFVVLWPFAGDDTIVPGALMSGDGERFVRTLLLVTSLPHIVPETVVAGLFLVSALHRCSVVTVSLLLQALLRVSFRLWPCCRPLPMILPSLVS